MPRIRRPCSRSPAGTPPNVWGGSKVCRRSTQGASKRRSRTQRAEREVARSFASPPLMDKRGDTRVALGPEWVRRDVQNCPKADNASRQVSPPLSANRVPAHRNNKELLLDHLVGNSRGHPRRR